MNSSRLASARRRILTVSGALVLGASLAGCGQLQQLTGPQAPSSQPQVGQQPSSQPSGSQVDSDSTTGSAGGSGHGSQRSGSSGGSDDESSGSSNASTSNSNASTSDSDEKTSEQAGSLHNGNRDDRCHTGMLSARVGQAHHSMGGKADSEVVLTNKTQVACTLYGYGGLGLVDQSGQDLPTHLKRREGDAQPQLIKLAPGQSAKKEIYWGEDSGFDEQCTGAPVPTKLKVTPPDEQDFLVTNWPEASGVCDQGEIDGGPYQST